MRPENRNQGAVCIAVDDPQAGRAQEPRDISFAQIQHPLRCPFGLGIVAQRCRCIGDEAVGKNVVRRFLIQLPGELQGLHELIAPQKNHGVRFFAFEVSRNPLSRVLERGFRLIQVRVVSGFAGASDIAEREVVVRLGLIRVCLNGCLRPGNLLLGGRQSLKGDWPCAKSAKRNAVAVRQIFFIDISLALGRWGEAARKWSYAASVVDDLVDGPSARFAWIDMAAVTTAR